MSHQSLHPLHAIAETRILKGILVAHQRGNRCCRIDICLHVIAKSLQNFLVVADTIQTKNNNFG